MTTKLTIFPHPTGVLAVTYSSILPPEATTPFGLPYLEIDASDLPQDWSTSDSWEADFSSPTGYGLGPARYFIKVAHQQISDEIDIAQNLDLIARMKEEVFRTEGIEL